MDRPDDVTSAETVALVQPASRSASSSSSIADEGRFVPGTLLGGRYRIIALLGRGGMGEVYRATDLTLAQSVALKFLPEEAARDQRLLERFHGEVRVARQVSHPNVCRVYDIGEVEGTPFISMEYVDGEDLASLLTRIGRLPADKAIETARKICIGLAAAHDRGIVHRDLKPQNIMMNKRGEVVIMDFGLAAIADQLGAADVRSGTPAYMAPEQLKGAEVTARSDIYALGLVLYELFTGKRPFDAKTVRQMLELQEAAQLTSMTSIAADIDPAVEKAIRRCLEPDPAKRPATALAVAVALPGGDPLAAALAAGETPSPELVAAAGETEGLARKYSVPCFVLVAACLFGATFLRQHTDALMHAPLDYSPEVLAQKSRETASALGYPDKPADSVFWLRYHDGLLNHLKSMPQPRKWEEWLAAEAPISEEFRESPSDLYAQPFGVVTADNPAPIAPGMVRVILDGSTRLREFAAVPPAGGAAPPAPVTADTVFRAAGLDIAAFTATAATEVPPSGSDQISAWNGPHPKLPKTDLHVEIAWWKGRVTMAKVQFPWQRKSNAPAPPKSAAAKVLNEAPFYIFVAGMAFATLLAVRNWRLGRADRKGALKLALLRLVLAAIAWAGTTHPLPDPSTLFTAFQASGDWLLSAALIWMLYLALEPALRARWPHSIVTWNRLLAGRWRDAQVGAHVLIGAAVGATLWVSAESISQYVRPGILTAESGLEITLGLRHWLAFLAGTLAGVLTGGLMIFFLIFGLRRLVKRNWLAAILAALLSTLFNSGVMNSSEWRVLVPVYIFLMATLIFILLRLGLVATMAAMFFINSTGKIILGADWKAWWAPAGLATLALLLAIAAIAFWRSLGSRPLLGSEAAEAA
jgi:predicted Ser/Thr protein kinase